MSPNDPSETGTASDATSLPTAAGSKSPPTYDSDRRLSPFWEEIRESWRFRDGERRKAVIAFRGVQKKFCWEDGAKQWRHIDA